MVATRKHHDVGRGGEMPKGSVCKEELWLERGEICTLAKKKRKEKREGGARRGTEKEREEKIESA